MINIVKFIVTAAVTYMVNKEYNNFNDVDIEGYLPYCIDHYNI